MSVPSLLAFFIPDARSIAYRPRSAWNHNSVLLTVWPKRPWGPISPIYPGQGCVAKSYAQVFRSGRIPLRAHRVFGGSISRENRVPSGFSSGIVGISPSPHPARDASVALSRSLNISSISRGTPGSRSKRPENLYLILQYPQVVHFEWGEFTEFYVNALKYFVVTCYDP